MNPYAPQLGSRDPLQVIAATPRELLALLDKLGSDGVQHSLAPGKWTAREIFAHLADCDIAFGYRLRQALAEDHHTLQPFDQDQWARHYAAYDARTAVAVFSAVRLWNVALVNSVSAEDFKRPVTHPERGDMTFRTLVETMAGHDLVHLAQLNKIAELNAVAGNA